jgi:hypothetical protein
VNPVRTGMCCSWPCSGLVAVASFMRTILVVFVTATRRRRRVAGPHIAPADAMMGCLDALSCSPHEMMERWTTSMLFAWSTIQASTRRGMDRALIHVPSHQVSAIQKRDAFATLPEAPPHPLPPHSELPPPIGDRLGSSLIWISAAWQRSAIFLVHQEIFGFLPTSKNISPPLRSGMLEVQLLVVQQHRDPGM